MPIFKLVGVFLYSLLLTGCLTLWGGSDPGSQASKSGTLAGPLHVVAEAQPDAGTDRFALARLQSFVATELRLAGKYTSVVEGLSGAKDGDGQDSGARIVKAVITSYFAGKDVPAKQQKYIQGRIELLDGGNIIATYDVRRLAASGPFVTSSARSVELGFAKQAAKAVLGFE